MASYDRVVHVDTALAATLFNRIRTRLPAEDRNIVGCNDNFRLSRYQPGEEVKKHTDGVNQDKWGNRSRYTVNIFLNDDFTGGETEFWVGDLMDRRRPIVATPTDIMRHIVATPNAGRGVLFHHDILHCGNRVLTGQKFLIRTDVMVRDGF